VNTGGTTANLTFWQSSSDGFLVLLVSWAQKLSHGLFLNSTTSIVMAMIDSVVERFNIIICFL
jgi:hypothetical protein